MTVPAEAGGLPRTDAEIIAASLTDPEAFGTVFDRHAGTVFGYLARRIGDHAADDVLSEVFTTAFRLRSRYDLDRPHALPWLYGIATNLLHRHRRTERAHYRVLSATGVDPLAVLTDHADDVALRVTAEMEARAVAGALAVLTTKERDVLLLLVWGGLSYEQIALALDLPVGTVRSRLNRARQRLRAALGHDSEGTLR